MPTLNEKADCELERFKKMGRKAGKTLAMTTGTAIKESTDRSYDAGVVAGAKAEREEVIADIEAVKQNTLVTKAVRGSAPDETGRTAEDGLRFSDQKFNVIVRNVCNEIERRIRERDNANTTRS